MEKRLNYLNKENLVTCLTSFQQNYQRQLSIKTFCYKKSISWAGVVFSTAA